MNTAEHVLVDRRTEAQVAAQVVAKLLHDGLIRKDAVAVAAACKAVGVSIAEVQGAWRLVDIGRYRSPSRLLPCAREDGLPDPERRARQAWNKRPEEPERECRRCGEVKPIEEFQKRTDADSRRTWCDDCRKTYQRERYVKIGYRAVLAEVMEDDPCVGHACPECGKPFEVGQVVVGERVVHLACSDESEPRDVDGANSLAPHSPGDTGGAR